MASFRRGREIAQRNRSVGATTEELREAMLRYRHVFEALVEDREQAPRARTA